MPKSHLALPPNGQLVSGQYWNLFPMIEPILLPFQKFMLPPPFPLLLSSHSLVDTTRSNLFQIPSHTLFLLPLREFFLFHKLEMTINISKHEHI